MKPSILSLALSSLFLLALSDRSSAAPKYPICDDIGATFGVGISHFSAAGSWAETAASQYGVRWKYLYWYLVPVNDPPAAQMSFIQGNVQLAKSLGAIPVFTFYQLLALGQQQGLSGSEPDVVKGALQDAAVMKSYFDHFIFVLKTLANSPPPVIVQVEPDTWGFMIWAFGIEGNSDATTVKVKVATSGHPDVVGFPDHAGGLGKALLKLRDQYAPGIRLAWHASNFRTGHGGSVVASFYSSLGEWDLLVTEHPHVEADPKTWWLPWDEGKVATNLEFFSTLTSAARVPILLWQEQIGTTDFHLFESDATLRSRFQQAGVAGVLFSLRGQGNPDTFRADEDPALATVPPAESLAGGTAADMRRRLASYSMNPLLGPPGSICAAACGSGDLGQGGACAAPAGEVPSPEGSVGDGCSCGILSPAPAEKHPRWLLLFVTGALSLLLRRRRATPVSRPLPMLDSRP